MTEPQSVSELLKLLFETKQREVHKGKQEQMEMAWSALKWWRDVVRLGNADLPFAAIANLNGAIARAEWLIASATPIPDPIPPQQQAARVA